MLQWLMSDNIALLGSIFIKQWNIKINNYYPEPKYNFIRGFGGTYKQGMGGLCLWGDKGGGPRGWC